MSAERSRGIRPDIVGLVAIALTLLGVAMVQWLGDWGYLVAVPALALILYSIFAMLAEVR